MTTAVVWNTLIIVLGTCLLSTLIAFPLAWLIARCRLPGSQLWARLFSLPYILPSYLLAVSWVLLANPQVGILNEFYRWLTGSADSQLLNIYSLGGIVFVESTALFSIIFVNLRLALSKIDSTLEEAARLSGAGPLRVFREVTLPLIWPSFFAALLAVLLATLASFGVPAMLGGANRIYVVTTSIYSNLRSGSDEGFSLALWQSLALGVFSLLLVIILRATQKKSLQHSSAKMGRKQFMDLGYWTYPVLMILAVSWFLIAALPLVTLFAASFSGGGISLWDFSAWNLKAWHYVLFELPNFRSAIFNTLKASVGAASLAVVLSFALALLRWNSQRTFSKWGLKVAALLEDVGVFLFSLPGTVLAVGLLFLSIKLSFLGLNDSIWILLTAYFLKSFNLSNKVLLPAAMELPFSFVEAAKICGANKRQILAHVWLPLLKAALAAAFFVSLMPMLGELSASLMLYGPETETLGVLLFQLQEYADRPSAAVVGTLLVGGVFLLHLLDRSSNHGE